MLDCMMVVVGKEEEVTPSSTRRMGQKSLAGLHVRSSSFHTSRMSRLDDFSGLDKRRRSHSAECRLTLSSFLRTLMLQFALQYLAR